MFRLLNIAFSIALMAGSYPAMAQAPAAPPRPPRAPPPPPPPPNPPRL
jgi:hypothetical protein